MGQATINVRIDEEDKRSLEAFCADAGLNISTAVNMFVKVVLRHKKLPFEIEASQDTNPFFTHPVNRARLLESIAAFDDPNAPKIVKTMEELEAMADE